MNKQEDYIKSIDNAERRFITEKVTIETRAEDEADKPAEIVGYAFKFNKVTTIGGWFREEILPGAADDVLNDDIRCLFNHIPSLILARSVAGKGTLSLSIDEVGLKYSYITPDRSYAKDLENSIALGDVNQSSFAFRAKEVIWVDGGENELDLRQIKKFDVIYDVSPVTYPAYEDTVVAKRSYDAYKTEKQTRVAKLSVSEAQVIINKNNS